MARKAKGRADVACRKAIRKIEVFFWAPKKESQACERTIPEEIMGRKQKKEIIDARRLFSLESQMAPAAGIASKRVVKEVKKASKRERRAGAKKGISFHICKENLLPAGLSFKTLSTGRERRGPSIRAKSKRRKRIEKMFLLVLWGRLR